MNDFFFFAVFVCLVSGLSVYGCEREMESRRMTEESKSSQQRFESKSRREESRAAWIAECLKNSKIEGFDEKGKMMFSGAPCEEWADRAWK